MPSIGELQVSSANSDASTIQGAGGPPDPSTDRNGQSRTDGYHPERAGKFLSSIKARLFIWTVEYVVLAQLVLFIVLLSVFERYQLENGVEKSDVIGQLAARIVDQDAEGGTDAVNRTLRMLREQYGVEPLSYKSGQNARTLSFTEGELPIEGAATTNIDLKELEFADYFFNAFLRLFRTGKDFVIINNADHLLPARLGSDENDVVIKVIALDAAKLRRDTIGFMFAYFLQASVLMVIVAILMYLTGNRQIAAPLTKLRETVSKLAENPAAESRALTVEGQSAVGEIHEAETEVRKLKQTIRVEGFKAFLDYRAQVEHDVKDALIVQNLIAREIGNETDRTKTDDLADRLSDMQRDTVNFLNDIFDFVSMAENGSAKAVTFNLHEFCRGILCRNVHLMAVDCGAGGVKPENLLCATAKLNVPEDLQVRANRAAMRSAIENLIRNSIKAIRKSGNLVRQKDWRLNLVEIAALESGDKIIISVRDNGPGFAGEPADPEAAGADCDGSLAKGWGMGLEIVKDRMQRLGGSMEICEHPIPPDGSKIAGAEIRIVLPKLENPVEESGAAAA